MLGSLLFLGPVVFVRDPVVAVLLLSASFFFLEITNPVLWTLPLDIAGRYAGTAGGMMNTGFGIAGMVSPVVFGVLIQATGSLYRALRHLGLPAGGRDGGGAVHRHRQNRGGR